MPLAWSALLLSIAYLAVLFALASLGDRRAEQGRTLIASSYVYTLSLAVYCTAWTFYGSVGLAATQGLAFLPVYLGPTLAALLFGALLHKIIAITKAYGITSIADFISARYGKSALLGGLVTLVAVVGAVPYISLQLKAVAASVQVMLVAGGNDVLPTLGADTALIVTLVLAAFTILFGTRHIDATEHHQGMVLAVAFESVVKLLCFLAVGVFVTFVMFDGLGAIAEAAATGGHAVALAIGAGGLGYADWFLLTLLSGIAFVVLPRQFQVAVIENLEPVHLKRATWLLPLYLIAINIFVLPIALAGLATGLPVDAADSYVLALPLSAGQHWVALAAYLGGLSAATAMVIVETIALSTMLSNDLVMPVLLRLRFLKLEDRRNLSRLVLYIRRAGILTVLLCGYLFFQLVGSRYGLASIGLISFAAVAQFAPPIVAGLYWKGANLKGAMLGLSAGVAVWLYTLVLPAFAGVGWVPQSIAMAGPFEIGLLSPYALFGLEGLHPVAHSLVWSTAVNVGLLVSVSLLTGQSILERLQAILFVDVERSQGTTRPWQGETRVAALQDLLARFLGPERATVVFDIEARRRGRQLLPEERADARLVQAAERQLARAIGAASARAVVGSIVRGEVIGPDDLLEILDETSRVLDYSRRLEQKSEALERVTAELRTVNSRLRELDRLKDDFIATVSHELRTPLTSIRSFTEILHDNPDLSEAERQGFLEIVVRETERLTRLIDDLLDLSRIESGRMNWTVRLLDARTIVQDAVRAAEGLFAEKRITVEIDSGDAPTPLECDGDRLIQVVLNLLSNAAKFAPYGGRVRVVIRRQPDAPDLVEFRVEDDGPGIAPENREIMFEKFRQVSDDLKTRPKGSGLGLAICRQIIERFGGRIWTEGSGLGGAAICFVLPLAGAEGLAERSRMTA
jgi:Na+/proline symporter/nitrogen-specific signal transduction histidine kinase